jgi:ankyrin repeat protein
VSNIVGCTVLVSDTKMLKYFIRTIPLKHFEFEAKEDFNKYNTDKKFKKEYSKFTPAMLSIVSYNTSEDKKLECLKLLLEKGVNTNCKDEYDNNLLHLAV